jgi:hypothetical protein
MMVDISELAPIAKQLNEQTDQINKTISAINRKLAKLNLGIEIWLDKPLSADPWVEDDNEVRCRDAFYLGYGRLGDTWELLAKEVTEEIKHDHEGREYIEEFGRDRRASLLKGTRNARLSALEQLPELLDALKAEGERLLKLIDAGEKTAQSL